MKAARPLILLAVLAAAVLPAAPAAAQFHTLTLPPSGDNQRASVMQGIGLVRVTVDYSSPDVHGPNGEDRTGKIWGTLVPYGMQDLGPAATCKECPWRGGANEGTAFTTTHDIKVQGQPLPAGSYGLHFLPGPDEWTVIFSKVSTDWGSYFYDPGEDALRVKVKPAKSDYHEWLTYEFTDRQPAQATLALQWENLQVPMTLTVDNMPELYVRNLRRELRAGAGFDPNNLAAAAQYCLENKINLPEALTWSERSVAQGQRNFFLLTTLARLQAANGKAAESKKTMDEALNHPTAGPLDLHQYGRQLLAEKKGQEALAVFELNARRHPDTWPVHVGLTRGHAAVGDNKEALEHARKALAQAPDERSRKNVEDLIQRLEAGKSLD